MQFEIPTIITKRKPYWCLHHSKNDSGSGIILQVQYIYAHVIYSLRYKNICLLNFHLYLNPLSVQVVGECVSHPNNVFYNYKATRSIEMKLWPIQQGCLRNSLRSKLHLSAAFTHAQMTYFEIQSELKINFLTC